MTVGSVLLFLFLHCLYLPRTSGSPVVFPQRLVHLDLKGAPPKTKYLLQVLPVLKKLGATGLLLEYEAAFPFVGEPLHAVASKHAYTRQELTTLLDAATRNKLTVVPLVNAFSNLEYILNHPQFEKYRENPRVNGTLCPSHPSGVQLVKDLLDQVANFHGSRLKYVHIGCGNVGTLGQCPRCSSRRFGNAGRARKARQKMSARQSLHQKYKLYLSHTQEIARHLRQQHGVRTIVWHDMLTKIPDDLLAQYSIAQQVDVMVSNYHAKTSMLHLLGFAGRFASSLWVASAFKGVSDRVAVFPGLKDRLANQLDWAEAIQEWDGHVKLLGIALMGPQRQDSASPLCELFPVGLPSLAVCLAALQKKNASPQLNVSSAERILGCNGTIDPGDDKNVQGMNCSFPGAALVDGVGGYVALRRYLGILPYLPPCKSPHGRPSLADEGEEEGEGIDCAGDLKPQEAKIEALSANLTGALREIYEEDTVQEWITSKVNILRDDLKMKKRVLEAYGSLRILQATAKGKPKIIVTEAP